MSAHIREAWARRIESATYTYEVDWSQDKDTLKDGRLVDGTSTVIIEADSELEARLMAEQMVSSHGEPTAVRRMDRQAVSAHLRQRWAARIGTGSVDWNRYLGNWVMWLAQHFNVPEPKLVVYGWGTDQWDGSYKHEPDPTISIYRPHEQPGGALLSTVAHEFAHYLDDRAGGDWGHGAQFRMLFAQCWGFVEGQARTGYVPTATEVSEP